METDAGPAAWHPTRPAVLTPQPGMFSLLLPTRGQAESFPHLLSLQGPVMDLVCLMRAPCFSDRDPPAVWGDLVASGGSCGYQKSVGWGSASSELWSRQSPFLYKILLLEETKVT